jgi:hypothetical protein
MAGGGHKEKAGIAGLFNSTRLEMHGGFEEPGMLAVFHCRFIASTFALASVI